MFKPDTHQLANARQVIDLINGGWTTQVLGTAVRLKLADLIAQGKTNISKLAIAADCSQSALRRLMQGLSALGMLQIDSNGHFTLTESGELLRSDTSFNVHGHALWWAEHTWDLWRDLHGSVQTGRSVRNRRRDQQGFEHLQDSKTAATFHRYMVEQTQLIAGHVASSAAIPASGFVLDVGGGSGSLLCALLQAHPALHGAVFDLAHAKDSAESCFQASEVAGRAAWITGDFFEPIAVLADVVVLKSILHDWDDTHAAKILGNAKQALLPNAALFIIERVLPDCASDSANYVRVSRSDLNMLVGLGGRERSLVEYRALLAAVQMGVDSVIELPDAYSLLVCR